MVTKTNFFGNEMSEKDSIKSTLRNLKITIEALQSQLDNGVDPAKVKEQLDQQLSFETTGAQS